MGGQENGRYLGIIDVHGTPQIVRSDTEEGLQGEINRQLEKLKASYPNYDWSKSVEIIEAANSRNGHKTDKIPLDNT